MLTPCQRFKHAFLSRCIDAGLTTPEEILPRVKQAFMGLNVDVGKLLSGAGEAVGGVAKDVIAPLAIAGPPVAGFAAGLGASKLLDMNDTDADAMKNQQVVDEYRRQTERLKREGALRKYVASNAPAARFAPQLQFKAKQWQQDPV